MHSALKEYNHMPAHMDSQTSHGADFSRETRELIRTNKMAMSFKVAKTIFIGEASVGKTSLGRRIFSHVCPNQVK